MRSARGKRKTFRRFASVMAAVGALLVSSGIALMVSPTSADATPPQLKDYVCKYVGTPGTGEHLKNGNDGLIWVDSHASTGTWFNDAHGSSYVLQTNVPKDPKPDASLCPPGRVEISVDIHFVDPNCENENTASYYLTGDTDKVTVAEDTAPAPGEHITVTATAKTGYIFDHWKTTYSEKYKFGDAEENCTVTDAMADVTWTEPSCENENTVDYTKVEDQYVESWETSGTWEPGGSVTVTATAVDGHLFAGDPASPTKVFEHTFDGPEVGCTVVDAPVLPEPPTFVEPTCTTDPAVQLPDITGIEYVTTGDLVAGGSVEVTATAKEGYVIPEGETTMWQHTFIVPTGCTIVSPPEEPTTAPETVTPTVVHAGLADTGSSSTQQQGLALMLAGLLLLAGAGGLVVVKGGERR
jgi:hypothetical protein